MKYKGKKIKRNDPCFCGSGKKHKKCCGGTVDPSEWEKDWQLREVNRWIEYAKTNPEAEPSIFLKKYAERHGIFLSKEHKAAVAKRKAEGKQMLAMMHMLPGYGL